MSDKTRYHYGTGRRKTAVARVRMYPGKGAITVNGKTAPEYFGGRSLNQTILESPLVLVMGLLAILPLLTGIAAFAHWSPFGARYEAMLAIHILSVELLMIWMPFGKIFHVVTSLMVRFRTGAAFSRRGVRA